jgi:hypothetical protein
MRTHNHTHLSNEMQEDFESGERTLDEGDKLFFKLFEESTFEGSQAAARKMNKYAKRKTKIHLRFLLFHSLHRLLRSSNSEMLSWPNSPLLVLVQLVNPDVLHGHEHDLTTPLRHLAMLADTSDYSTHEKQLILAKQLVEHGANVNAVSSPLGTTPLHDACSPINVTNLDFVEILMEAGANPNAQDEQGLTPLTITAGDAPGAAKFLLNWPTTDVNITDRFGESFLAKVRSSVEFFSDKAARPDNLKYIYQFMFQQWREIEDMVVERGGTATGITHSN